MGVHVKYSGPLFDGKADKVLSDFERDTDREVGNAVVRAIQNRLKRVLRHPTGFYQSKIQTETLQNEEIVTDNGVIYGPWLEGVSSRNRKTRFKGYHTFRIVTQQMQQNAFNIAKKNVGKAVDRLN